MNHVISVKNLTVKLGGQVTLDHLSFDIGEGSITAIIGPNGSGKTTLLRAMLGLIPSTGEVTIFGRQPAAVVTQLAYVPQRFSIDPTFPITVEEFLRISQRPSADAAARLRAALLEVDLADAGGQLVGELSGGQLQRALIAKALLGSPRILFLDEPSAGIDVTGERNLYELIRHLNRRHGVTVLIVSHEIDIVTRYASWVLCLNGQMLCQGEPQRVLTERTIQHLYGSTTIRYQHHHA
ncbi:MAG: metal ABC transporter ATP-binding protein [Patescibacteria group bacterium]